MKVNCRKCDICGEELGERDFQIWLRKPIIKWGAPVVGMRRMDICADYFTSMEIMILNPELIKKWKEETTE